MGNENYIDILPTRNPSEISFRVRAQAQNFRPHNIPTVGDAYKNTNIPGVARANTDGLGDYVYCYMSKESDTLWFYFCKNKTAAERNTPFNTYYTSRQWRWPNILNDIEFVPDNAFPLVSQVPLVESSVGSVTPTVSVASVYAARLIERMNITPEALALSMCKVEQFTSDVPWSAAELTHPQPTEGVVSWDFNGAKGSITCLHPDIKIPARGKAYTTIIDGNTLSAEPSPNVPNREFPATNFEAWEPFVVSDDVVRENGVYFRERVTIYPPEENQPSIV
jgi:hypothetical protein